MVELTEMILKNIARDPLLWELRVVNLRSPMQIERWLIGAHNVIPFPFMDPL
jgi:hypothetical protein